MKRRSIFWMLVLLPFLLMVIVNETSAPPTDRYLESQCSRHCHNVKCRHAAIKYGGGENSFEKAALKIYWDNIKMLKNNKLGLSYKEMNLLVYVFLFPVSTSLLLWGVLRKGKN